MLDQLRLLNKNQIGNLKGSVVWSWTAKPAAVRTHTCTLTAPSPNPPDGSGTKQWVYEEERPARSSTTKGYKTLSINPGTQVRNWALALASEGEPAAHRKLDILRSTLADRSTALVTSHDEQGKPGYKDLKLTQHFLLHTSLAAAEALRDTGGAERLEAEGSLLRMMDALPQDALDMAKTLASGGWTFQDARTGVSAMSGAQTTPLKEPEIGTFTFANRQHNNRRDELTLKSATYGAGRIVTLKSQDSATPTSSD